MGRTKSINNIGQNVKHVKLDQWSDRKKNTDIRLQTTYSKLNSIQIDNESKKNEYWTLAKRVLFFNLVDNRSCEI